MLSLSERNWNSIQIFPASIKYTQHDCRETLLQNQNKQRTTGKLQIQPMLQLQRHSTDYGLKSSRVEVLMANNTLSYILEAFWTLNNVPVQLVVATATVSPPAISPILSTSISPPHILTALLCTIEDDAHY